MTRSEKYKLNLRDAIHGAIMMAGTTITGLCANSLASGVFPTVANFLNMGKLGLLAGGVYISKSFFTNSTGGFTK